MTEHHRAVAEEIFRQIGGQALMMIGAKNKTFGVEDNGNVYVTFKIGRNKACNYIKITLNALDLYDMEFIRIRDGIKTGYKRTVVKECNNVYFDMLNTTIEEVTGMYTHF